MKACSSRIIAAAVVLSASLFLPAVAIGGLSDSERLDRIERQLDSRSLLDMWNQIEQLQRTIQQLRGDIEVQAHKSEEMQRRQRELYLDIDRRFQQLETGKAPQPVMQAPRLSTQTPPVMPAPGVSTQPPPVTGQGMTGAVAADPANEKADYEKALVILREGRYADAAATFNRFLTDYPGSRYTDNASYWLGETYYVTRDFDRAMTTFSKLVEFYPQSPKVPDARLKIGYIHYENKDWSAARQELNALVADYPGTTAARLASDRVRRMQKEGH
jgi:tol-pal system protein YbgF